MTIDIGDPVVVELPLETPGDEHGRKFVSAIMVGRNAAIDVVRAYRCPNGCSTCGATAARDDIVQRLQALGVTEKLEVTDGQVTRRYLQPEVEPAATAAAS